MPPVQHQDFMQSLAWRKRYWARSQLGYPAFKRAHPNAGHRVLAAWERQGNVLGLVTQNVDGLHQRAGHASVIDLHGRLDRVVCMTCGDVTRRQDWQDWLEAHNPRVRDWAFEPAPDGDADPREDDYSSVRVPQKGTPEFI